MEIVSEQSEEKLEESQETVRDVAITFRIHTVSSLRGKEWVYHNWLRINMCSDS